MRVERLSDLPGPPLAFPVYALAEGALAQWGCVASGLESPIRPCLLLYTDGPANAADSDQPSIAIASTIVATQTNAETGFSETADDQSAAVTAAITLGAFRRDERLIQLPRPRAQWRDRAHWNPRDLAMDGQGAVQFQVWKEATWWLAVRSETTSAVAVAAQHVDLSQVVLTVLRA
jgi:hypothetical protein